jgi:carbamoyl-phosphate synthase large subunit
VCSSDLLNAGKIDLVINIPREYDKQGRPDGYMIRRRAVDLNVPLFTNMQLARAVVEAIAHYKSPAELRQLDWASYLARRPATIG